MDPKDELEIRELMKKVEMKTVPQALLKNYESEVLRKVKMTPSMPYGLLFSGVTLLAVGMAFGTWIFISKVQPEKAVETETQAVYKESAAAIPVYQEERAPLPIAPMPPRLMNAIPRNAPVKTDAVPIVSTQEDTEEFKQLADDLFILEMLGEDDGILDSMQRAASDIEMASQVGTVAF